MISDIDSLSAWKSLPRGSEAVLSSIEAYRAHQAYKQAIECQNWVRTALSHCKLWRKLTKCSKIDHLDTRHSFWFRVHFLTARSIFFKLWDFARMVANYNIGRALEILVRSEGAGGSETAIRGRQNVWISIIYIFQSIRMTYTRLENISVHKSTI